MTNYLSQMWRAPVLDETELKGAYNFVLATSRVEPQPEKTGAIACERRSRTWAFEWRIGGF